MGQCLGAASTLFDVQGRRQGLGDARVQRGRPAGDDETVVGLIPLVPGGGSVAGPRAEAQRRSHDVGTGTGVTAEEAGGYLGV